VLAVLVSAGIAYAAVTSLVGSDSGSSPPATASAAAAPAWLGVDMGTFASGGSSSFPSVGGVVVTDVVPGGPAAVAGLQPGDLITQIDNRQVGSPNDVDSVLVGMHPGQQVQIQYQRGPFAASAKVTLAARPKGSP
jgi:S1-C subfamily serine protease